MDSGFYYSNPSSPYPSYGNSFWFGFCKTSFLIFPKWKNIVPSSTFRSDQNVNCAPQPFAWQPETHFCLLCNCLASFQNIGFANSPAATCISIMEYPITFLLILYWKTDQISFTIFPLKAEQADPIPWSMQAVSLQSISIPFFSLNQLTRFAFALYTFCDTASVFITVVVSPVPTAAQGKSGCQRQSKSAIYCFCR